MLGPIVLVALPLFLSVDQLGFWYAMTGLAAIIAFADMGVATAVMQFSAHEYARLQGMSLDSNERVDRQDALLVFAIKRIGRVCALGLPIVFGLGIWTMSKNHGVSHVAWLLPWACFCLASALSLMLSVLLAFQEGQDAVSHMQRLRAGIAVVTLSITVGGAASGLGLWTLPLATGLASLFGIAALTRKHLPGMSRLRSVSRDDIGYWSNTIAPVLTRYGLSWIGGYLMFQLFAPIAIYLRGPALAGRVGLTVSIFTAVFTLANVWSAFRLPSLSMAVARRDGVTLRRVFLGGTVASLATYAVFVAILFAGYVIIGRIPEVAEKLLDPWSIALLAIGWGFQVIVHNAALFLRAFKVDPLVTATWAAALHTLIGTVILLWLGEAHMMFVAFVTSFVWLLPVAVRLCHARLREIAQWPSAA